MRQEKATCTICGAKYFVTPTYRPSTCDKDDCIFRFFHPNAYKKKRERDGNNVASK
tara:strand:- start:1504 stop:1671 length:168 start_codon:yes stop_codon:yes gene_type:complete